MKPLSFASIDPGTGVIHLDDTSPLGNTEVTIFFTDAANYQYYQTYILNGVYNYRPTYPGPIKECRI